LLKSDLKRKLVAVENKFEALLGGKKYD